MADFVYRLTLSSATFTDSYSVTLAGLLTGCGQKWGIVRHHEGQLHCKKDQLCGKLCSKLCGNQLLISNILWSAKWCFDWYFSFLSNGINIISCNHISCFILVSNRQRLCHIIISSRKKLLHMETKGSVYKYNMHLFSENSPRKSVCVIYTERFVLI